MNSFTIRFEGSLSLQDRDENGARSILIQNLRIYLPEEIERGLVPSASTAPCPPPSNSEEYSNKEVSHEIQEKQEEVPQKNEVILTPYSVITEDEDDDDDSSQLTFQWSWSHTTPPSSSSSSSSFIPPPAPIKSKPNKQIDPFDFSSSTPIKNKSSSKIPPSAPIKSKPNNEMDPFDFSSSSNYHPIIIQSSSASMNHKPNEDLFLSSLKQFHMVPEGNPSRNPQNKQKDYHHFMFWHHFQHNGHSCDDNEKCMKYYLYEVVTPCCLTENEDHDRQRCQTLESIMKRKGLLFEPTLDYYVTYKNYLSKNERQPWRHNLNRYKLMEKFVKDTY